MIEFDQLLQVVTKIESRGYTFYTELSGLTHGDIARIFEKFADDERKHSIRFKEIFGRISREETATWSSEEVVGYLKAYAEISIFPKLEKNIPAKLEDALMLALDIEKESIAFYFEIETYLKDPLIMEIIREEREHFRTILKMLKGKKPIGECSKN